MTKKEKTGHPNLDSGYAWVILIACFTMYLTVGGPNKTYGILYAQLLVYFRSGSGNTAWIGSICSILSHCLGPLSNFLSRRFSFRTVTFIGGFLYGLGHISSGFVSSIKYMYFTYSILCGFGLGLLVPPTITVVNFYFDKRRSFANGIVISASGVGAFFYPFLYRFLIKAYGLQGALLILGAVFLHSCVGACLIRQPLTHTEFDISNSIQDDSYGDRKPEPITEENDSLIKINDTPTSLDRTSKRFCPSDSLDIRHHSEDISTPSPRLRRKDLLRLYATDSVEAIAMSSSMMSLDIKSNGSPANASNHLEHKLYPSSQRLSSIAPSTGSIGKRLCYACCQQLPNLKLNLFKNPRFCLHVLAITLCVSAYSNNQMIIPAHVVHMGFSMDDAAMCISVMGACDLACRLLFGWFADKHILQRKHIVIGNVSLIAALCCVVPQVSSLPVFAAYSGITGGLLGSIWSLSPALVVDVVGMKDFSQAFGLLVFWLGCAFVAQPIAGWLEDLTGNWHASFYFTGGMLCLSVCAMMTDTVLQRQRQRTGTAATKGEPAGGDDRSNNSDEADSL